MALRGGWLDVGGNKVSGEKLDHSKQESFGGSNF
jgi:hypothetical protein